MTMSKKWKVFASSLAIVALALVAACKHQVKTVQPQPQPPVVETTAPVVAPPPTPVPANTDFVKTDTQPTVTEEEFPRNLEDANRVAQERGYIRDAFFGYDESTLSADAQSAL